LPQVRLVLLIPIFPPVSTITAANLWEQYLTTEILPLRNKFIYMLIQEGSKIIIKTFLNIFLNGAPWAANISVNFRKIWNGPNSILLWHCPFNRLCICLAFLFIYMLCMKSFCVPNFLQYRNQKGRDKFANVNFVLKERIIFISNMWYSCAFLFFPNCMQHFGIT
jgi:hypothetical protein